MVLPIAGDALAQSWLRALNPGATTLGLRVPACAQARQLGAYGPFGHHQCQRSGDAAALTLPKRIVTSPICRCWGRPAGPRRGIGQHGAGLARRRQLADLACRCCDAAGGSISTMLWLIALVAILQSLGLWLFDPLVQLGTALTSLGFLPGCCCWWPCGCCRDAWIEAG